MSTPRDDLKARARIRNAAIHRFGQHGFGVPLRAIAADAGVSAALVIHHFGSKEGLRTACDAHAREVVMEKRRGAVRTGDPGTVLAAMADTSESAPIAMYIVASLAEGGTLAREFVEAMIADAQEYIGEGVASGLLRPSRDEAARTRFLAYSGIGALILHYELSQSQDDDLDAATLFRDLTEIVTLPALELYTHGMFADDRYLRALLSAEQTNEETTP